MRKKIAFTLAELLITLTMVGILANLTIPALIQNVQEIGLRSAFKETYSTIDQATKRIMLDNGGTLKSVCTNNDHNCIRNKYAAYMPNTKACDDPNAIGNCWHKNGDFSFLNGTIISNWGTGSGLVLNNGAFLLMLYTSSSCSSMLNGIPECGYGVFDTNGYKQPNKFGKDIYDFHIVENGIKPFGIQGDSADMCSLPSDSGQGCAAKYLMQ